jgi:putative SOS response-associated peptidase YedK
LRYGQLQRAALHDVAIRLPQKYRTMGWLRCCRAALPRSGFVQYKLCRRRHILYSITTNQAAISALFRVVNRYVGNLAPMPGVFPDYKAPIVRAGAEGRELATARWGMPSSSKALMDATKKRAEKLQAKGEPVDFKELLPMEPDSGTTNIRNVKSKHWARWLGVENRCVVPFNSFSEFNKAEGGDI